jgi:hypothetical protein
MEINDLREFDRPSRLRQGCDKWDGEWDGGASVAFLLAAGFGFWAFPLPLFPLHTIKEQALERLTYSTLPSLDGRASNIIQSIFVGRRSPAGKRLLGPP